MLVPPDFLREMVKRGWTGNKAGQGFYKKQRGEGGKSEFWVLDYVEMDYRAPQKIRYPSIDAAKTIDDTAERIRTLIYGKDRVGEFLWKSISANLSILLTSGAALAQQRPVEVGSARSSAHHGARAQGGRRRALLPANSSIRSASRPTAISAASAMRRGAARSGRSTAETTAASGSSYDRYIRASMRGFSRQADESRISFHARKAMNATVTAEDARKKAAQGIVGAAVR